MSRVYVSILLAALTILPLSASVRTETKVSFDSDGWTIFGDLYVPDTKTRPPVVILLHTMWNGNRTVYGKFAEILGEIGIASLRIDLRGHGESINKGRFEYPVIDPKYMFDAWPDLNAARDFLETRDDVDADRLGVVGASYSGEIAAKAGRFGGYAKAYAILASGMLSPESIIRLKHSKTPLVFVWAEDDPTWAPKTAELIRMRQAGEVWSYETGGHATDLLTTQPKLARRLAEWFNKHLRGD